MLSSIRRFSKTIFAKILLGIVVIPFVFWGMGTSFTGGSKNVVLKIDKDKFSTQDFVNFIQSFGPFDEKVSPEDIDSYLTTFIGNKLIEKEYKKLGIVLSEKSLSRLLKNQKEFKKNNIFSRTEYEKFLLSNNFNAAYFENKLALHEKRKQLLDIVGGGIIPAKFMINSDYNKVNQKRNIQLVNLNSIFLKEYNFSEDEIQSFYNNNSDEYKDIFKSVKILEINPKMLTGNNNFNDIFFKKVDEIYDDIAQGKKINAIINDYNLEKEITYTLNKEGKDINYKTIDNFPKELVENIFSIKDSEPTVLIEYDEKFFILEVFKTENIQKSINNKNVQKKIKENLQNRVKRKFMSKIISLINQNSFKKSDFDKFSKDNNIRIQNIKIDNLNDEKILDKEAVSQIYAFPEKRIIVVNDIYLTKNYLIYIDEIENVSLGDSSDDYQKYFNLSKIRLTNGIFNSYDDYIKKQYDININYKALKIVKGYFN